MDGREFSALADAGLDPKFLDGPELKVYEFIGQHVLEHGVLPKMTTITQETGVEFPKFPDEPFGYWVKGIDRRTQSRAILEACKEMKSEVAQGNVKEARALARNLAMDLEQRSPTSRVLSMATLGEKVVLEHDRRQMSGSMSGVPFGIEYLDRVSDGAQPGDSVALVGRPGVGKTYLILQTALNAHTMRVSPLVVGLEMTPMQMARRVLALKSGVASKLIRLGRLSHWGKSKVMEAVGLFGEEGCQPFYLMQGALDTTVEDLIVRVQELRPGALYVDGAYLLQTRRKTAARWERVTETAEVLKMIAVEFNIPVIATYQFNRSGSKSLANIAFSDAVGQLASIVIAISDEHSDKDSQMIGWDARSHKILSLLKGREGERGKIKIVYDMARMVIEQEEVISGYEDDMRQLEEPDERGTETDEV